MMWRCSFIKQQWFFSKFAQSLFSADHSSLPCKMSSCTQKSLPCLLVVKMLRWRYSKWKQKLLLRQTDVHWFPTWKQGKCIVCNIILEHKTQKKHHNKHEIDCHFWPLYHSQSTSTQSLHTDFSKLHSNIHLNLYDVNTGGVCGGCGMAALQEVSGLATVQEYLHCVVCDSSYLWADQCCNHGPLHICYSLRCPLSSSHG